MHSFLIIVNLTSLTTVYVKNKKENQQKPEMNIRNATHWETPLRSLHMTPWQLPPCPPSSGQPPGPSLWLAGAPHFWVLVSVRSEKDASFWWPRALSNTHWLCRLPRSLLHTADSCFAQLTTPTFSRKGLMGVEIHKVLHISKGVGNDYTIIQAFRSGLKTDHQHQREFVIKRPNDLGRTEVKVMLR